MSLYDDAAVAAREELLDAISELGFAGIYLKLRPKQANALQGVGNLAALLQQVLPAQLRPLVPDIVAAVHEAFTTAVANIFWTTLVAGALALVCTLVLRDVSLRTAEELREEVLAAGGTPAGGLRSAEAAE